jgi:hypothetical protein
MDAKCANGFMGIVETKHALSGWVDGLRHKA